jgi:hypothetical protein
VRRAEDLVAPSPTNPSPGLHVATGHGGSVTGQRRADGIGGDGPGQGGSVGRRGPGGSRRRHREQVRSAARLLRKRSRDLRDDVGHPGDSRYRTVRQIELAFSGCRQLPCFIAVAACREEERRRAALPSLL